MSRREGEWGVNDRQQRAACSEKTQELQQKLAAAQQNCCSSYQGVRTTHCQLSPELDTLHQITCLSHNRHQVKTFGDTLSHFARFVTRKLYLSCSDHFMRLIRCNPAAKFHAQKKLAFQAEAVLEQPKMTLP